jgi:N-acetylneuraminic acid mutarotase
MNRLWSIILLLVLAACGGGGGGGGGGGDKKTPVQEFQMFRCTVHRQYDGLTGIGFWGLCPNENWNLKSGQPVFPNKDACWTAVEALKRSDPYIYDNSQEDRDRGMAEKLWCFEPDTTPPAILSVSPANDSNDFPVSGSSVHADFSDNMDSATITAASFTLEDSAGTLVAGTVSYGFSSRVARFKADAALQHLTTYTARLTTSITDKVGNPLTSEHVWSFTTEDVYQPPADETAPQLVVELPSANSTCGLADGVVTARFNEPVVAASGAFTLQDSSGGLVDGTLEVINTLATFTPSLPLSADDVYTAQFSGGLTDIAGNALAATDWSFRTELAPEGTWTPTATPTGLAGRSGHTAVWTGSEMIIWGGNNWQAPFPWFQYLADVARYDPDSDQWSTGSASGAPQARGQHTATWTGTEMLVWGGVLSRCSDQGCLYSTNTGGRYNPATDTWSPMSTVGAPSGRRRHTAIWTGSELIIWGGVGNDARYPYDDGARYDPATDTWSPLSVIDAPAPRGDHKAVFDGERMIVWGGTSDGYHVISDGSIYDPVADMWTAMPILAGPGAIGIPDPASVASSGTDMFVQLPESDWNQDEYADEWYESYFSETYRFNYQDQQWHPVVNACDPLATPNAVWLNGRLLGWNATYSRGETYSEVLASWAPITPYPKQIAAGATVVVAGDEVIVWGGRHGGQTDGGDSATNVGYRLSF